MDRGTRWAIAQGVTKSQTWLSDWKTTIIYLYPSLFSYRAPITSNHKISWPIYSSDGKESACKRPGFNPWVRKIPWRRNWQPTPVFLPGKFHGQRSLAGYSPRGRKELTWLTHTNILNSLPYLKLLNTSFYFKFFSSRGLHNAVQTWSFYILSKNLLVL